MSCKTISLTQKSPVMEVKFTENKLIELFIAVDDLYKSYVDFQLQRGDLSFVKKKPTQLHCSEICTILVAYNYSGYKCFEYYYRELIMKRYSDYFPSAPTYEGFLGYIPKAIDLIYLWLLHSVVTAKRTGLYFIDSKKLQVCHLRRGKSNKVFKEVARKGKTSTGWFFGLKIHRSGDPVGNQQLRSDCRL